MARQRQKQPRPDQLEDDDANLEDLSFSDDRSEPPPRSDTSPDDEASQAGLTGAAIPVDTTTDDDMAPETLFDEDGARGNIPTDQQLREAGIDEVGAGEGLDEAELGRVKPLDKKPWNGDSTEALGAGSIANEDFPAGEEGPERIAEKEED